MNKKIAVMLFAFGLSSAASVSAFQQDTGQCAYACFQIHRACLDAGNTVEQCRVDLWECRDRCGI